jgi:very-short-patch-repair endonuclease
MHPLVALDLRGGVARWTELARLGVSRRPLLRLARAGLIARPSRGVFCRPELVGSIAVRAVCASGQLTCSAGAEALGLDTLIRSQDCHVRTPPNSPRTPAAHAHRWGLAGPGRVATTVAVLHDCALCLPVVEAVVVIDSALRRGLVAVDDWPAVEAAGPRGSRVAEVLALADSQAQSVLESVARVLLLLAGLTEVASQVFFEHVGWVDLVVDGWLVVELDGWEFHREKFREDRHRDAELSRQGCVVLRFTYADLMSRREWFVEVVREVLDRGRPPFGLARPVSAQDRQSRARER